MNPFIFFLLSLKASLFSVSGLGNVPSLHSDLIERGWSNDAQFAEAISIGQISPGPNGLWVVSLGYLIGGIPGALYALFSSMLPSFLVLGINRIYGKMEHRPEVKGFIQGLSLASMGVFSIVLLNLLHSVHVDYRIALITLASAGLSATRRLPLPLILALAGVAGVLFL